MVITFDPSSKEAEAGRSLRALGQPVLHNEFQESQNYTTERPCLKRNTATKKWFYFGKNVSYKRQLQNSEPSGMMTCSLLSRRTGEWWGIKAEGQARNIPQVTVRKQQQNAFLVKELEQLGAGSPVGGVGRQGLC